MTSRHTGNQFRQFDDFDELRDHLRSLPDDALIPDMTDNILGEVGRRRGWLGRRQRSMLVVARLLIGAVALATIAGILVLQRNAPPEFASIDQPSPIGSLVETVEVQSQHVREFVIRPSQVRAAVLERPISAAADSIASFTAPRPSTTFTTSSAIASIQYTPIPEFNAALQQPEFAPVVEQTSDQSWRSMDMLRPGVTWSVPTIFGFEDAEPLANPDLPVQDEDKDDSSADS